MEFRNTINFKGTEYSAKIKASSESLSISFTDSSQNVWSGFFSTKIIEDLSTKAGNSKSFPIFCKLLITALQGKNPSLHAEFYSYQDLESIRSGSSTLKVSHRPSKKKYLIISYVNEFEKVHYPLALTLQDSLSPSKEEISTNNEFFNENYKLRQENAALHKNITAAKEEILNLKESTDRKINKLLLEKEGLENEIHRMKEELDVIIYQLEKEAKKKKTGTPQDLKSLKISLNKEKEENISLKMELSNCRKEIEYLKQSEIPSKKTDVFSRKLEFDDHKDIEYAMSSESPVQSSMKINVVDFNQDVKRSAEYVQFMKCVSKLEGMMEKFKSNS